MTRPALGQLAVNSWRRLGTAGFWLCWPALRVYLRLGARARVLVLAEDHVLLVQGWLSTPEWSLPGGGLHRAERPEDGAVRETLEEAGVRLDPGGLQPLATEWCTHHGLRFYCHFFVARLNQRPQPTPQRGEIVQAEWVPLARVQELPLKPDVLRGLELWAGRQSLESL